MGRHVLVWTKLNKHLFVGPPINLTRMLILRSVRSWLLKNHDKSRKNNFLDPKFLPKKSCFGVEKRNVGNRLKRVLAKFRTDRSLRWDCDGNHPRS